ncbi:MAG: multidrug effflux MFS transporter [Propionibacteriaceae bacterium]
MSPRPKASSNALITAMIAALAMIGPFSIDALFPAYDLIGREIHASTGEMQQVTSVYMLSFAVMSLFHGPISDAIGRKKVMAVGMLAYALASLVCMVAPNLTALLLGRVLQGAFAGAGQIVSRTIIRDLYMGPAAQKMMAQVAMIFAIAPAIAPIVGGWVIAFASWRTIFGGLFVVGVLLALMVAFGVPETHPLEKRRALDVGDVLEGVRLVLSDRPYLRLAFAGMFGFGAQFIYIVGAPIIMLQLLRKGEQDFWMMFVPFVCGMILGSYVNARLAHRIPPQRLVSIAMVALVSAALVGVVVAVLAGNRLPWVMICPPVIAFSMAVSFPILQLAMLDRFPTRRGAAASGQSFILLLFTAVLSGVIVTLVATSMAFVAITSAVSGVIGASFWLWHLRRPPRPRADQA